MSDHQEIMARRTESSPLAERISRLIREPLFQFMILGAFLVGAHFIYRNFSRPKIGITRDWVEVMARDFEVRAGRRPTDDERQKLIVAYLNDEILYREGLKAGHVTDPRVRHLLGQTMREKLEPVLADPRDEELQIYRDQHPESWRSPAAVSFAHASFESNEDVPDDMLAKLQNGEAPHVSAKVGMSNPLPMTWLPQLDRMLGKDFSAAVLKAPEGEWTGPITSQRGVHFVKVLKREDDHDMPFEEVKPALISKWMEDQKIRDLNEKLAVLKRNYRIELPAVDGK